MHRCWETFHVVGRHLPSLRRLRRVRVSFDDYPVDVTSAKFVFVPSWTCSLVFGVISIQRMLKGCICLLILCLAWKATSLLDWARCHVLCLLVVSKDGSGFSTLQTFSRINATVVCAGVAKVLTGRASDCEKRVRDFCFQHLQLRNYLLGMRCQK